MLTLGQAARLAKTSKTSIGRAIKAGRLSATRREDGGYAIDPSELARVFEVTPDDGHAPVTVERREPPTGTAVTGDLALRLAVAEAELKALKDMVTELRAARDAWQSQAERLALPAPPPPMTSVDQPVRRPWWKRLAGEFDANRQRADSRQMAR